MKAKLYTKSHRPENLSQISSDTIFTAEEHSWIIEAECSSAQCASRRSLISHSLLHNLPGKYEAVLLLAERVLSKGYKTVFSVGSGFSDLEYFLQLAVNDSARIVSSDFDSYLVSKSREFFPEIKTIKFDMLQDTLHDAGIKADIVVSFSSFYVLEDDQFIRLMRGFRDAGVVEIVDFHAGYMNKRACIRYVVKRLLRLASPSGGKFHGFSRSYGELMRLYELSGWKPVAKIFGCGKFEFSCILEPI